MDFDSDQMSAVDHIFSSQTAPSEVPPSSPPLPSRSNKPKRAPTITPRRFNRFFNPSSSRANDSSPSLSTRALKALTAGTVNSRHGDTADVPVEFDDFPQSRPIKRRKLFGQDGIASTQLDYDSDALLEPSSPIRSSPCPKSAAKPVYPQAIRSICRWEPSAIRRARQPTVVVDPRYATANFCTVPEDIHSYAVNAPPALPFCVASCNTNSLIALGDEDGHVRIVDSSKGGRSDFSTPFLSFKPHNNAVMGVAFSSDDRWMATASGDQTAKVIDMFTQKSVFTLAEHTSSIKQASFQPGEDNILATCSRDGVVALWDLRCARRAPVVSISTAQDMDDNAVRVPKVNAITNAHRPDLLLNSRGGSTPSPSITSLSFLSASRSNLILTSSDASARLRLWDIRARHTTTNRRPCPIPLSATTAPPSHEYTIRQTPYGPTLSQAARPKGISNIALNTDASRIYAVCKDNTVYAYSTNHLIMGQAPELQEESKRPWRQAKERDGLGPLYGLRHPSLSTRSFYVRCAVRKRNPEHEELLAVGSSTGSPVLFPTDERCYSGNRDAHSSRCATGSEQSLSEELLQIYDVGTPLIRGHDAEVTGVSWTNDGELVSVSDDYTARIWREDVSRARELRSNGEGEGARWRCGWAENDPAGDWDEEDG